MLLLLPAGALGKATTITILHVNDTHSHLDAVGPNDRNLDGTVGGFAKAASVIATMRATEANTLFVHAGDLFNGDSYFAAPLGPGGSPALSVPEMQLLAQLGLDVMTLGNHEFGLGTGALAAALHSQMSGEDLWHTPIAQALLDVAMDAPAGSPLRDSPIADLVTDALRAAGRTDIALTVNGFLTEGLTHGRLVPDDAFRIVGDGIDPTGGGLGFPLYELRIDGLNLLTALETGLAAGDDFFVQVSGMSYLFDSRRPAGSRLVGAFVHGKPVDPGRIYSATVNLGVVNGLSQFPDVRLAAEPLPLGVSEYAAVRDWMAHLRLVLYFSHGRAVDLARIR